MWKRVLPVRAHIFLKDGTEETLLAKVENLEVVPRGIYVIDGEPYQYTGQPTFVIEQSDNKLGDTYHVLKHVEITVEKTKS